MSMSNLGKGGWTFLNFSIPIVGSQVFVISHQWEEQVSSARTPMLEYVVIISMLLVRFRKNVGSLDI